MHVTQYSSYLMLISAKLAFLGVTHKYNEYNLMYFKEKSVNLQAEQVYQRIMNSTFALDAAILCDLYA